MPDKDTHQLKQIHQQILQHFNDEELRTLCFHVGVEYDDLGGRGRAANARELVQWAQRNNRLSDLMALIKEARPHVPDIVALLPPHHILYRRNELFTGREEWLRDLHTALHQNEPIAVTQAVAGLGGVGKTQLALAYCYRHQEAYDLIQWLRADDAVTLGTELAELAYRLGLARRSMTDQAVLHELALNWLHTTNQRWLLVYDNADAIQPNELRPFLPKLGHGACLITSRNPNWGTLAQTMRLTHFSDTEAVAFLLGQPELTAEAVASHPDGEDALRLAKLLGHLPLALEHARAYVEGTGCTLADYADYFENERQELWGDELPAPADYDEKTITTTWELAFAQAKQTPGAAALLNLCCFLAPDEIPLDLLLAAVGAEDLPLPEDLVALAESKLKLDKAIAALRRYSLLERDGETLALHRLVQTVARDQMPPELRQRWAQLMVNLLLQAWPYDHHDLTTWERSGDLLAHLLAAADEAEKVDPQPEKTGLLLNDTGVYLYHRAAYDLTLNLFQRALEIDERAYGPEHTTVAVRLNNLGRLLQAVGEYEAARPYMERALAIDEKVLGPEHPNVAR
ncbi:MAG: tetratricopeptide repeat protein, partial [Ardenticatenaceae bacterium]|nr:tetratricopeptide repeat protein [Ardenticatenaceae bacterium]